MPHMEVGSSCCAATAICYEQNPAHDGSLGAAAKRCTVLTDGGWGAGKSTLLDILSLRKTSGKIAGEVSTPRHWCEVFWPRPCMSHVSAVHASCISSMAGQ